MTQIRDQVKLMKHYRTLFQFGRFYRLRSPFAGNITAWLVVSPDQQRAAMGYFKVLNDVNAPYRRQRIPGLLAGQEYRFCEEAGRDCGTYTGSELANIGLVTSDAESEQSAATRDVPDFYSRLFIFEATKN